MNFGGIGFTLISATFSYAILFVAEVAIMIAIGYWKPRTTPYTFRSEAVVNMIPWKYSLPLSVVLLALVAIIYVIFSPIGLAYAGGFVSKAFWPAIIGILAATLILSYLAIKKWNNSYAQYLHKENATASERLKQKNKTAKLNPRTNEF